ncbi:uncharacterized protein YjiS (DUF1127 family) [Ancylobacter sp. 3268]|uniref:DUF1127 domain-containing protein n=1 Tax=Ancylobacter sp. 3268 TaxID=2817752 RepID=UPI0028603D6A|nr:DUF1127 domain-containing protein [Ancylobacter sp. 3268]MDR6951202.1 uncharacterized protein YjiS (DUF1127 family) [Ancylobacter sp. 3268]
MQIAQIGIALRTAFARHLVYKRVAAELAAHTDRQLADFGLARRDIPAFARQAAGKAAAGKAVGATPAAARQPHLHVVHAG